MLKDAHCSFKLEKLPTISQSLVKIIQISKDSDPDIADLAAALSQDPTMTARIFDVVSTIHYRPWKDVKDLHRILVVLGLDSVRRIIFTCAVEQVFDNLTDLKSSQVQILWYRSLLCAHLAEELARLISFPQPYEAYLAGLLHRIGQLILIQNFSQAYIKSIDVTAEYSQVEELERQEFGISSLEIGADLVDSWQLPSFHADALRFQTQSAADVQQASDLVRILNFCQQLSCCDVGSIQAHTHAGNRMFGLTEGMLLQLYTTAYTKTSQIIESITGAAGASHPLQALSESHAPKDETLNNEVKQQALLSTLQSGSQAANTLPTCCFWARQDICLLFGLHDLCFFFVDADQNGLRGYDDTGRHPQLSQVMIGLDQASSPISRAVAHKTIQYCPQAPSGQKSLPEQQLCHILHKDDLCYLPLLDDQDPIGVCVLGLKPGQREDIKAQSTFLLLLADQIALRFKKAIKGEASSGGIPVSADELDFELRAIVHEVNNPLSIIATYLHLLASKVIDNEQTYQQVQIIQEEIQRVSALVAGLREIANPGQPNPEPTDINKLIEKITNFYQKSVFQSKGLEAYLNLDPDIPCIVTQPDRVKQIIINLMKNAAEALQEKGKVYITTRDNVFIQGKMYIELEIEDNGPGIEQEILTHLFQPGGRSKNKQSGLGLIIVKNLVSDLGGDLSIRSGNWGTRFQIRLPRIVSHSEGGEAL